MTRTPPENGEETVDSEKVYARDENEQRLLDAFRRLSHEEQQRLIGQVEKAAVVSGDRQWQSCQVSPIII